MRDRSRGPRQPALLRGGTSRPRPLVPGSVWTVLGSSGITILGSLPAFLIGAQAVYIMRELGFGEARLGVAIASFFAVAALSTLLGGKVVDRAGRRVTTVVAGVLATVGSLWLAAFATTWLQLVAAMSVLGLANAACQTSANLSMATAIPAHRRGLGFGIKQAAVPLSIVLAGLAVPIVSGGLGWRATFVATGVTGLVVALAGLRVTRSVGAVWVSHLPTDRPPLIALSLSMLAIALASAAVNSMAAYLPTWAYQNGLTPSEAGILVAVGSAVNVTARIVGGHLADRRQGRNLPVVASQMALGAVGVLAISFPATAVIVPASVLALGVGWAWPGLMLFAVVRVSRDMPGMASGMVQAGAFSGAALGPFVFGMLIDSGGYGVAWRLAAGSLFSAALLVGLARRMFLVDLTARPPREAIPRGRRTGRAGSRRG